MKIEKPEIKHHKQILEIRIEKFPNRKIKLKQQPINIVKFFAPHPLPPTTSPHPHPQSSHYLQNTAARVVLQVSKFQHISPVLCELHWLPIQYRIIFKILLLVYKSLNGTSPSYLAQKLHYRSHTRSLRSVSNELLMQPRSYTKTYGDRAFAVHAPREWNLIPYEIRKSNTSSSFKRSLKTYLFTKFSNGSLFL